MKIPYLIQVLTGLMLGAIVMLIFITPAVIADDPWWRIIIHFTGMYVFWNWRKEIHKDYEQ